MMNWVVSLAFVVNLILVLRRLRSGVMVFVILAIGYALEGVIPRASRTFRSPVTLESIALLALADGWARFHVPCSTGRHRWILMLAGIAGVVDVLFPDGALSEEVAVANE